MSHQIESNMIAFRGETPWHGLGVQVTDTMTADDMLEAAKMNWKVQRRALAMRDAKGMGLLTNPLANFRAIVREDTNEVFQVASDKYYPVQNQQIVDFFKHFCDAGHAKLETVGALQNGRKVWALAKLNGGTSANLGGVDQMLGYMLLATAHDGSLQTVGQATNVRVVCWNTLSAALGIGGGKHLKKQAGRFMMKHSAKWTEARAEEARRVMGMASIVAAKTNELADKLSKVTIDEQGRIEYVTRLLGGESLLDQIVNGPASQNTAAGKAVLEAILDDSQAAGTADEPKDILGRMGKQILEAIIDSPGSDLVTAKDTMWGAVNGVTYFTDHVRGRSADTRLASAWFGQSDQMKQRALEVACDMVGVQMPTVDAGAMA